MSLRFGTDGVRGVANIELTPELALALGRAAQRVLGHSGGTFVVGRDPRLSGPMLHGALVAGLASEGANVVDVGVLPTPAVAFLGAQRNEPAAMVSASHNAYGDNGIKFFLANGRKLTDETEDRVEDELAKIIGNTLTPTNPPGEIESEGGAADRYVDHLIEFCGDTSLQGLSIVLDCANGAASSVARQAFTGAGAKVEVINDLPDGRNINDDCGSTHPAGLQSVVIDHGADLGLAFDGDADRVIAVDDHGGLVDGDHMLAMLADDMHQRGELHEDVLVVTVMSNLGLRIAMNERGIKLHVTPVGDRYVLDALFNNGWSLGGEQSGHVIIPAAATTGDGLLTGLKIAETLKRTEKPLSALSKTMTTLPQILRNVRVVDLNGFGTSDQIKEAVRRVEERLGDTGRVLLRPSGTEPVIRVMAEAARESDAQVAVDELCEVVTKALGEPGA